MALAVLLVLAIGICCIDAEDVICVDNNQCDPEYCCSMSEQRFSIPVCRKWQAEGESCRPDPIKLKDIPFSYPDGSQIKVTRAYSGICPCEPGLSCDRKNGVCV